MTLTAPPDTRNGFYNFRWISERLASDYDSYIPPEAILEAARPTE